MGINTRQSGDTSIVLTPSQSYDEETREGVSAPVTEPTTPVSTPALSIDERLDRIKAVTNPDTVPAVYTEDEHANDVTAEGTSAETDMAAPSEETAELVDETPKIVDHIEFVDAPENIAANEDVVEPPEVSAEDA